MRIAVGRCVGYHRAPMLRSDFHFDLPDDLIAQQPLPERRASRLLMLDAVDVGPRDARFEDLVKWLRPGDLLVFNDTRVIPARLLGRKASGGCVELLLERAIDDHRAWVHLRASHAPKPGSRLLFDGDVEVEVAGRDGALFEVRFHDPRPLLELFEAVGHMPLPPYIQRTDNAADRERYQTVYARHTGAVAAPTAGLHFDAPLLERIRARGIDTAFVTLHVGAGTFKPMQVERVEDHRMHPERVEVGAEVCRQVAETRARGGRVVAVGTTSVRSLEAAAEGGELAPFSGQTRLFITPGYRFRVVDALVTNFHLSESTLLMLVCAFAGKARVMAAYRHAIEQRYRFFSYGDAMLLTRQPETAEERTDEI